jgi:GWxTD domain-containing protein
VKSSWICWLIAASLVAGLPATGAEREKRGSADEVINLFLSPGYAQWLAGPIAHIATDEEIEAYLAITDDEAAERFIDEFWSRRVPVAGPPGVTARQQFERLAEEADRKFGEDTLIGRRTDRGTIFILYGPPAEVDYQPARKARAGLVEIWKYEKDEVGMDGNAPKRHYYFIKRNDVTVFALPSEWPKLLP